MAARIFVVTGTDTGVGKTVLTALLTRYLRAKGVAVAALKPVCSGGRGDARALRDALDGALTLDEINPWHFRAPLAPLLAARKEGKRIQLAEVVAHVQKLSEGFEVVLVEGAGGLLSPLGEDFSTRELLNALRATPVVVASNRLGAINQVLLVLAALPAPAARHAHVVLNAPARRDATSRSNPALLSERIAEGRIHPLPHLADPTQLDRAIATERVRRVLDSIIPA